MRFTIEVLTGLGNVLKSFITALSIGPTNIRCRKDLWHPTNYREILDDSHICFRGEDYGHPFTSCRLLILASEGGEQKHLDNEFNRTNIIDVAVIYPDLKHLFAEKNIDWFYDRSLISDKVFNRIMSAIEKIKWRPEVLTEVERVQAQFIHPVLSINIRTWTHKYDPPNLTSRTDEPGKRVYNFETYKSAIETFLPDCKSIFISADNDNILPEYLELLKDYKIIIYKQREHVTYLQYAAANILISSKCDYLVCNRLSTFSECIWWFSGCRQKVISLF
jgi:hypothetical protein